MVGPDTLEADKATIHQTTFEILRPEILKLKDLMEFHEHAVKVIKNIFEHLVRPIQEKQVLSESILDHVVKSINCLMLLDELKDMKACIRNDFSLYKRAFEPIREYLSDIDQIRDEYTWLGHFLCNQVAPQNFIMLNLKNAIQTISGYDYVIVELINHCSDAIEEKRYLLPEECHTLYRVLPCLMYLLDAKDKSTIKGLNAFKHPKVKLSRMQKLFKPFPIIPLYGDMQIEVHHILRRCFHWEDEMESSWTTRVKEKLTKRYSVLENRPQIREQYIGLTAKVAALANDLQYLDEQGRAVSSDIMENVFTTVLDAMQHMSAWSAKVVEQSARKYAEPVSEAEYKSKGGQGGPGDAYDKRVKYNYTSQELHALVDVMSMIKGLGALMMKSEDMFVPLIRWYIHDKVQDFLQKQLAKPLRKAHKRNREVKKVMIQMRNIGGDWINRDEMIEDYKQDKKLLAQLNRDFPRRAAAPSVTQISLLRRMIWWVCCPKSPGMQGGMFKDKDLKKEWAAVWVDFYRQSFFYDYLLDYHQVVRKLTDMSHFWYREFYLEISKCIQFPIGMSMPWILTDFLIHTPSMKENIFFPFDIYNDAASRALGTLKQQFLYDEIEAELNLSFDQLIFHLSDDIFKYYKTVVASVLIDKPYKSAFQKERPRAARLVNSRYVALMAQRHVNLLGRTVDINELLSQHVNGYFRRNVEYIIKRFEASSITSAVELKNLYENVMGTHLLLSEHLNLDPWDSIWREINMNTNVGRFRGRVMWHVFTELITDIIPSYIFNSTSSRFVPSPVLLTDPPERERPPRGVPSHFWYGRGYKDVFEQANKMYGEYFGMEHIDALLYVLHPTELPLLLNELVTEIENKLIYELAPYVSELSKAIPPMKPPKFQYGVVAAYEFYNLKLKTNISVYPALRVGVFQLMREIGNLAFLIQVLETCMSKQEDFTFQAEAYFNDLKPHPFPLRDEAPSTEPRTYDYIMSDGEPTFLSVIRETVEKLGNKTQQTQDESLVRAAKAALDLHPYVPHARSIFSAALERISNSLNRELKKEWDKDHLTNSKSCIYDQENPQDFVRFFSSLQFIFCQPTEPASGSEEKPIQDFATFGDGFFMCGCLVMHCLGMRHTFNFSDLAYKIIKFERLDPVPTSVDQVRGKRGKLDAAQQILVDALPALLEFLTNGLRVRCLNDHLFSLLETYFKMPEPLEHVIDPPSSAVDDNAEEFVKVVDKPISHPVHTSGSASNAPVAPVPTPTTALASPTSSSPPRAPAVSSKPTPPATPSTPSPAPAAPTTAPKSPADVPPVAATLASATSPPGPPGPPARPPSASSFGPPAAPQMATSTTPPGPPTPPVMATSTAPPGPPTPPVLPSSAGPPPGRNVPTSPPPPPVRPNPAASPPAPPSRPTNPAANSSPMPPASFQPTSPPAPPHSAGPTGSKSPPPLGAPTSPPPPPLAAGPKSPPPPPHSGAPTVTPPPPVRGGFRRPGRR